MKNLFLILLSVLLLNSCAGYYYPVQGSAAVSLSGIYQHSDCGVRNYRSPYYEQNVWRDSFPGYGPYRYNTRNDYHTGYVPQPSYPSRWGNSQCGGWQRY